MTPPLHHSPPPRISLCIIAGNVPQYIGRFLDAFSSLVDEVNVVIATGAQEHMPVLSAVSNWKDDKGMPGAVIAMANGEDHKDWHHVDDFAKARQFAFKFASHDWILWADTDDIIDPASIARIKEQFAAHHHEADAFSFAYHVPEDGLTVIKDRLVRKSLFQWRYRVHEELVPIAGAAPRYHIIEGATITHMPSGPRTANDERNVRLLEAMRDDGTLTTGHRFHLMNSLRAVGRTDDALTEATALLKCADLGDEERFETLMALGQMCPVPEQRGQFFLQSLRLNPNRREAYGELAVNCAQLARFPQMLGFTTAMMAIPEPREYVWNHRAPYYGAAGVKLHAIALRANGRRTTGDVLQQNHFKKHGAMISLLHATRGRCKQALVMQNEWLRRAADPDAVEHIFAIDADDESAAPLAMNYSVILPPGGGCVAAWNAAAQKSAGAVLVQMSDDFMPPMHWDKLILDRLGDISAPAVLAVSDGFRTDDLLCMAILTRARYAQQGFLFHPRFKSMYSDNYFTHCAARDGIIIDARDLTFEHLHPAAGKAEMDQTYAESNTAARYAEGLAIYNELTAAELNTEH